MHTSVLTGMVSPAANSSAWPVAKRMGSTRSELATCRAARERGISVLSCWSMGLQPQQAAASAGRSQCHQPARLGSSSSTIMEALLCPRLP